jgi:hypothetical protein
MNALALCIELAVTSTLGADLGRIVVDTTYAGVHEVLERVFDAQDVSDDDSFIIVTMRDGRVVHVEDPRL